MHYTVIDINISSCIEIIEEPSVDVSVENQGYLNMRIGKILTQVLTCWYLGVPSSTQLKFIQYKINVQNLIRTNLLKFNVTLKNYLKNSGLSQKQILLILITFFFSLMLAKNFICA